MPKITEKNTKRWKHENQLPEGVHKCVLSYSFDSNWGIGIMQILNVRKWEYMMSYFLLIC